MRNSNTSSATKPPTSNPLPPALDVSIPSKNPDIDMDVNPKPKITVLQAPSHITASAKTTFLIRDSSIKCHSKIHILRLDLGRPGSGTHPDSFTQLCQWLSRVLDIAVATVPAFLNAGRIHFGVFGESTMFEITRAGFDGAKKWVDPLMISDKESLAFVRDYIAEIDRHQRWDREQWEKKSWQEKEDWREKFSGKPDQGFDHLRWPVVMVQVQKNLRLDSSPCGSSRCRW